MRREHEIWMEGYSITGNHSSARFIGTGIGEDFNEAIIDYMAKNEDTGIEKCSYGWVIYGCRLFPNEYLARQSFG